MPTIVAALNELTDSRYHLGYWQLRYYRVAWKPDGKLYWEYVRSGYFRRLNSDSRGRKVKRLLRKEAKKNGFLVLSNVYHGAKVLMSQASVITNIMIPYCMDALMEMDHPQFGT